MAIRFTRSAARHRIGADRARYVIDQCLDPIYPTPEDTGEPNRILFLGPDQHGVSLEVLALELAGGDLLVIHVMGLSDQYADDYARVMAWHK